MALKVDTILNYIDLGNYALPVFQRGYVWSRDQVRNLMSSLYKGYPIGGLLLWVTKSDAALARGEQGVAPGNVSLILDGQQRITTLYGLIRGEAPPFFDGNARAFTGLYFNLDDEVFEFYMPAKMKDNPRWVSVTEVMQKGTAPYLMEKMKEHPELMQEMDKLNRIDSIKQLELPTQEVTGTDKTIEVVVEIFNNVNSGGTKLSYGDLALAKLGAQWPEVRDEMKAILKKLDAAGYSFSMDWLLRCLTVYMTLQPYFNPLTELSIDEVKEALPKVEGVIGDILDRIASRLGLDNHKVLKSVFAIPVLVGALRRNGDRIPDNREWDKLLYWYVHTFLWGRYSASTESVMAQDLNILNRGAGADGLIRQLRQNRGHLRLTGDDFRSWSTGARMYPLLYLLTRVYHARDLGTGIEMRHSLLGRNSQLEVHHIFPKKLLYDYGYKRPEVNALGNFMFLTKDTNLAISDRNPQEYLPEYQQRTPGALESNWLPTGDSSLYDLKNYPLFLERRRELLAEAANEFLDSLLEGTLQATAPQEGFRTALLNKEVSVEDETQWKAIRDFLESNNLPEGQRHYELVDAKGEQSTTIDWAWPEGLQEGLSQPVALLLEDDSDGEMQQAASRAGYITFLSPTDFMKYAQVLFGFEEEAFGSSILANKR